MSHRQDTVVSYLERFPDIPSNTLAKKIFKETKPLFETKEQARSIIRYMRGKSGKENRKELAIRRFIRDVTISAIDNRYELPESDALEYPVFKFPKVQNRILVASDAHVPYHSVDAITCMIDWGKEHEINAVLLNGDWMDCHRESRYVRDPRLKNFKEERDVLWNMLDTMQNALPNTVFYYRQGNHERRYEDYMKVKAAELFDTTEFQFDILMKFGERGIIYIGDKLRVQAGKLIILHGDEYPGSYSPVNPAKGLFNKAKASAMCGHFHQVSEHSEPDINDNIISCWSVGCLSELHPAYMVLNKWQHGFARIKVLPDESFEVTNLKISNGKVL